jgi:hypothetical protein
VTVVVPTPSSGSQCARLVAALPQELDGRGRRATSPVSDLVVAWGSPAVVLRCGVPAPTTDAGDHLTVDGVSWLTPGAVRGTVVWTTTGRTTSVELSVPDSVTDQETLLGTLAPAVSSSLSPVPGQASATAPATSAAPATSG